MVSRLEIRIGDFAPQKGVIGAEAALDASIAILRPSSIWRMIR